MRKIKLATGKSRTSKQWKNVEWTWEEFTKRVSNTHRTTETVAEYAHMKKPQQDAVKDIGGFVAGHLDGGQRKNGNVRCRSMLTLDLDFAEKDFWDTFSTLNDMCACIYSTHKHTPAKPRLRLIIPMSRDVSADEYEAVARKVAESIGVDQFDDTTYQPTRLMYWPSTSKDGQYVFESQDGEWLDPDKVLKQYPDWRDVSYWPQSSRVDELHRTTAKRQGDPCEKDGVIGAFCRTYTIREAIEKYLPDVYEPCGERYTYRNGSTAAGLVIYDDKWAYSNHGTDPASGRLCNAFDLLRIHMFNDLDEEADLATPVNRLPSYKAMLDFCIKDADTKQTAAKERLQSAQDDFKDVPETDNEWMKKLEMDRKGRVVSSIANVVLVLENDPRLKGKLAYNELRQTAVAVMDLPWRKVTPTDDTLRDGDDAEIRLYLERAYNIEGKQKIDDGIMAVTHRHRFHPVQQYLNECEWDGKPRVETLFIDYLGAEDSKYVRAVTRKSLAAAVARAYKPGIKYDTMVTFIGRQGIGKSTMIRKLAVNWGSASIFALSGKESCEQLQGVWIAEMEELNAMKKAEVESIKSFLSRNEDRYRQAYGRRTETFPRSCVLFGTTNNRQILRDETGNRRFWIVDLVNEPTKSVFSLDDKEIRQIWAEARIIWESGETLYLDGMLGADAQKVQEEHIDDNPKKGMIEGYVNMLLPEDWAKMPVEDRRDFINGVGFAANKKGVAQRDRVCALEIWVELFGKKKGDITRFDTREINAILDSMPNLERAGSMKFHQEYGVQKGYRVKENDTEEW